MCDPQRAALQNNSFILAGAGHGKHPGAIFTLDIPESFQRANDCASHYTFKVRFKAGDNGYGDTWFVNLLTGPDNWANYRYIGMLNPETGEMRTTKGSNAGDSAWSVRFIRRVFACLWCNGASRLSDLTNAGFRLMHEGRCGRCGKKLTVPSSIECGLGPICQSKV